MQAKAHDARCAEGGVGGLRDFDGAVEEVFSRGEELEARAEVVGGVGVEAEESVEQEEIGVVVVLVAAQAALQASVPIRGLNARRFSVAMLRATSGIQLPRSCAPLVTVACAYW